MSTALERAYAERKAIAERMRTVARDAEDNHGGVFTDEQLAEVEAAKAELFAKDAEVDRLKAATAASDALKSIDDPHGPDPVPPLAKAIARAYRASAKALTPSGNSLTVPVSLGLFGVPTGAPALLNLPRQRTITGTNTFSYLQQGARAANAAFPVPRGDVKPSQTLGIEPVEDRVRVYPVLSEPIAETDLADVAGLEQWLSQQLAVYLRERLERDMVIGDDDAPTPVGSDEFDGIAATTGVRAVDTTGTTRFQRIRNTLATLEANGVTSSVVVLNPLDFASMELTTDAQGQFLVGGLPNGAGPRTLFGRPVVLSSGMPVGNVSVGDWRAATELVTREALRVTWSNSVDDDFQRNQVRFRVEGRFGFAVEVPSALAYGALGA